MHSSFGKLSLIQLVIVVLVQAHENSHLNQDSRLTTIKIYHSIGSNSEFKLRGTIILPYSREKEITIKHEPLSNEDITTLKESASKHELYFLKAVAYKNNKDLTKSAHSFTTACSLVESNLSDILTLSLDYSGNLIGISETSLLPTCSKIIESPQLLSFNTTVQILQATLGPVPDTHTYIQRMEQEKHEKLKGEKADNRSFISKYWMYGLPFLIIVLISSTANPGPQPARSP